jgi:hypothetical protein
MHYPGWNARVIECAIIVIKSVDVRGWSRTSLSGADMVDIRQVRYQVALDITFTSYWG